MNCILVTTENKKYSRNNYQKEVIQKINDSIDEIIDIECGFFYYSRPDACRYYNVTLWKLSQMLLGNIYNTTNLILSKDYEKGLLPNTLYKPRNKLTYREGFGVVDYDSGKVIGSTIEVANIINIDESLFRNYLKGIVNNKTNYIYEKDYIKGISPQTLCNKKKGKDKVINIITKEIYESQKDVANYYNVSVSYISKCLKNIEKSGLPLLKLEDYDKNKEYSYMPEKFKNFEKNKSLVNKKLKRE